MLGVEKFGIDVLRGYKVATDDEDFGRDVTAKRSDSARGLIQQAVIVLTSEDLGDKTSTLGQKFCGKLQTLQNQLVLSERILNPSTTNVGSTVMEN